VTGLKYRSDIDGLRAVAVLAVVIYHAFPNALPGGFCGVDIFFVISGYLISGILFKGLSSGEFSFLEFYKRRVKRIFPSLIAMLILCLGYGWVILFPHEFSQLGKHVAAGSVFIQNITFYKECGYWETESTLKPLLHLWSLAVEEQFYIIFPILMLLFWKAKWPIAPILIFLLTASIVASLVVSQRYRESDFFLTQYRAWEFLGGALLAWNHFIGGKDAEVVRNTTAIVGLIIIALSLILIHEKDPYPGWRAVFPVIGTILVMGSGREAWINKHLLSARIVVWIGLISYPLYLVHWPVLSFLKIIRGNNTGLFIILLALALTMAVTCGIYYLWERPLRSSRSGVVPIILCFSFMGIGGVGWLAWNRTIHPLNNTQELLNLEKAMNGKNPMQSLGIPLKVGKITVYSIGGWGKQTVYLGDSNMQQYAPRISKRLGKNSGESRGAIFITNPGTPPIPGVRNDWVTECDEMMPLFEKYIQDDSRIDKVVISGLWRIYFKPTSRYLIDGISIGQPKGYEKAVKNISKMIEGLQQKGIKVYFVSGMPTGKQLDPANTYQRDFLGKYHKSADLSESEFYKSIGGRWLFDWLMNTALISGAQVIDPTAYLIKEGICIRETKDGPVHCNANHLCDDYARDYAAYLDVTTK
jgi:peptidoglycan/LPS O-acetylase OafA/YrhL